MQEDHPSRDVDSKALPPAQLGLQGQALTTLFLLLSIPTRLCFDNL